jgi:hypothetical protein
MKRYALILVIFCFLFSLAALPAAAQDDRDGDGTPDGMDTCPDAGGPSWAQGCPDSDGDGAPDIMDNCPDVGGHINNLGCPEDQPQVPSPAPPTAVPQPRQPPAQQQPQQPVAAPPTEVPAQPLGSGIPSGPVPVLPNENGCLLTPDGAEPINLRAVPSLQGSVLGPFEPGNRAPAGVPVVVLEGESWYLTGGGWLVGRLMQGTPLCLELPVLNFAESGTTLVNQDNSFSPSIPVGIGDTRPIQLYLMPHTTTLLNTLVPRLQLPAGESAMALRFPSLRSTTNELLITLLMPFNWMTLPDGETLDMVEGYYLGYPERVAEGETADVRDTMIIDMAAQNGRPFTLAISGIGRLRLVGDNFPTGMWICNGDINPVDNADGIMVGSEICPQGQIMPEISGISVDNIGGVLLLNAGDVGHASLLVYEGRGTEMIVQLLPGPNASGGSTPLLRLNQGMQAVSLGFHRPTQGMIITMQ